MMVIGHLDNMRPFKPNGGKGGSKKGKLHGRWPLLVLVLADAVLIQMKGSIDAVLHDRNMQVSPELLSKRMGEMLPGIWAYLGELLPGRTTPLPELLLNRVYKMYYSGTSDRGRGHDPKSRAAMSNEHWLKRTGGAEYAELHAAVIRGKLRSLPNWRRRLVP